MALNKQILIDEIRKITDESFSGFEEFPKTSQEAGERWAAAVSAYAGSIVPSSQEAENAESSFISTFTPLVETDANAAFAAAFTTYAAQLGLGMQPTFTATPPPTPIVLAPVFAVGLGGGSAQQCAQTMAEIVDLWFRTGSAVNNSSGAIIPWS